MANPVAKEAVLAALRGKGPVSAPTRPALQAELGLTQQFSFTQFWKAVKSLHYKRGEQGLRMSSWGSRERGVRMWRVAPL